MWRLRVRDAPAIAAEALSYPSDEYIRWYRGITQVCIGNPANRDTCSHRYQPAGVDRRMGSRRTPVPPAPERHEHVDPSHAVVEWGEGFGSGQSFGDPFDSSNLDMPSFSLGLTPASQSLPSGSGRRRCLPRPGTAGSSMPNQPISQAFSSNEEEQRMTWTVFSISASGIVLESNQWFSNIRYDFTRSGAFLDMGSGSPIDDLVESGTIRLLDWNDSMTDIHCQRSEIPVSNIIQEVQVLFQTGCIYKRACCEKWQTYTLPCSHVLAVCRKNGSRIDTYVSEIYSRQMYRRTYQSNFHPVFSENFWKDVPFNLTFYPPNMKKERDRK
ncbi:hypothetical protein M9H77_28556 [Catharanthus roseus]|uniref:Uncharacterized protein n=1 Tax=Catharanthus roseus TaxID=4058 RepID=A0ACC0AIE2_CATRO|nr:hypothetical protein M9H77_28556 [Catharanthus roseus]